MGIERRPGRTKARRAAAARHRAASCGCSFAFHVFPFPLRQAARDQDASGRPRCGASCGHPRAGAQRRCCTPAIAVRRQSSVASARIGPDCWLESRDKSDRPNRALFDKKRESRHKMTDLLGFSVLLNAKRPSTSPRSQDGSVRVFARPLKCSETFGNGHRVPATHEETA